MLKMTNEQRLLVTSLRRDGKGYGTIAKEVGLSINTVKSFCQRQKANEVQTETESVCLNCGRELVQTPGRKAKKFCCDECRTAWWNSHLDLVQRKAVYEYTCPTCGKKFSVYGDAKRKYCSHGCYIKDRFGDG
jgi:endogenous inhibitor of DNA gyrase (YacG/DUF329 family)